MSESKIHPRARLPLALALVSVLSLGLWGCGGDDNDNPGDPGGQTTFDDFDQATALGQSMLAASQSVAMVQSMTSLADGIGKDADKDDDYGWNEDAQRWEWRYVYSEEGISFNWFYTVQYVDSEGVPQASSVGAARINHGLDGTGSFHYESDGMVMDQQMDYEYEIVITGLGTEMLTMTGDGGYDFDYDYHGDDGDFSASYEITWATLPPGITQPAAGGCPSGTIRYDYPPYYTLVVFDGSDTAVSTLYNSNGGAVSGGSFSHALYCGTE